MFTNQLHPFSCTVSSEYWCKVKRYRRLVDISFSFHYHSAWEYRDMSRISSLLVPAGEKMKKKKATYKIDLWPHVSAVCCPDELDPRFLSIANLWSQHLICFTPIHDRLQLRITAITMISIHDRQSPSPFRKDHTGRVGYRSVNVPPIFA